MPTLNWIGKEAVVDHHREVPSATVIERYVGKVLKVHEVV